MTAFELQEGAMKNLHRMHGAQFMVSGGLWIYSLNCIAHTAR